MKISICPGESISEEELSRAWKFYKECLRFYEEAILPNQPVDDITIERIVGQSFIGKLAREADFMRSVSRTFK